MKTHAMQVTRWTAVSLLLLALGAMESRSATAENMLASVDASQQQQLSKPATPQFPQLSAEAAADLLVAHHRYLAAIAAYQKISPQTARIYDKTGIAYEHMFMNTDARAYFERALKLDKKFAPVYNNLGTIYYHERDFKRAERYYKRAIRLDAKTASFYGNLGTLYVARKTFHDAAEAYQRAFMLDPGVFQDIAENGIAESDSVQDLQVMNYCFAQIYAQAGMNDLAIRYLQKAVSQGFHDKAKLDQDQQFAGLHAMPEFQNLFLADRKQ
jgi:tetratricopeptide (TPR) repeat protein